MNKVLTAALALTLAGATATAASAAPRGHYDRDHRGDHRYEQRYDRYDRYQHQRGHRYQRGQYMAYRDHYRARPVDWRARRMAPPPRGYHYVQEDNGDVVLAAIATGLIAMVIAGAMN